jgi:hypothetical protein
MSATNRSTEASSVTSAISMETPLGVLSAAFRLVPKTLYPAAVKATALARPMPEDAPVIRATGCAEVLMFCPVRKMIVSGLNMLSKQ